MTYHASLTRPARLSLSPSTALPPPHYSTNRTTQPQNVSYCTTQPAHTLGILSVKGAIGLLFLLRTLHLLCSFQHAPRHILNIPTARHRQPFRESVQSRSKRGWTVLHLWRTNYPRGGSDRASVIWRTGPPSSGELATISHSRACAIAFIRVHRIAKRNSQLMLAVKVPAHGGKRAYAIGGPDHGCNYGAGIADWGTVGHHGTLCMIPCLTLLPGPSPGAHRVVHLVDPPVRI